MYFKAELQDFLSYIASEKGLAIHTIEAYERDLRSFLSFTEKKKLSRLKRSEIVAFMEVMKE